jgi:hypothetical protein
MYNEVIVAELTAALEQAKRRFESEQLFLNVEAYKVHVDEIRQELEYRKRQVDVYTFLLNKFKE